MSKHLPDLEDSLAVTGVVTVSAGAALVYPPAGVLVLGLLLLAAAVLVARGGSRADD